MERNNQWRTDQQLLIMNGLKGEFVIKGGFQIKGASLKHTSAENADPSVRVDFETQ